MPLAGILGQEGSGLALPPTLNLLVRRGHLIEDVFSHLSRYENEDLRRELLVKYKSHLMSCCREKGSRTERNSGLPEGDVAPCWLALSAGVFP